MLLNPTGGVLGGDHLITDIALDAGAHVCLTTPSATRVYRTDGDPATAKTTIRLAENATLEYFPDHVIPHAGSALIQSLHVEMSRGSRAILLDTMASGRVAHGERWAFREIDSRVEVQACGKPAYIHRAKIAPHAKRPDRFGVMEGFDYIGSLAIFADGFMRWKELCAAINAELDLSASVRGGASLLPRGGCVVRFLARSAPDLTLVSKNLWDAARESIAGLPPFDHRKY